MKMGNNLSRKAKSRWCVLGHQDPDLEIMGNPACSHAISRLAHGVPSCSSRGQTQRHLRGYYAEHNLSKSTVFTKKKIYPVLFCQDYYSTYAQCINTGTICFTSSEQLYIKPGVSEQVELGVYGYALATMIIRNGIIEIAKS